MIRTYILDPLAIYLFISPSRGASSTLPQIGCVCSPHSSVEASFPNEMVCDGPLEGY